ncbi:hypothetical protein COV19_05275 [Candidatus Woesearchaeota archaeon CG10_big_fil_rev_8_21_14_0_10_44_13]|nr:MAG: hypothetical protein COV19_05275 [Candidatus Woesearchaeota archaeon CG10_big_fil_rev_8_21_14_0_10_44_13]
MKRKVVKQGPATFMISLPSKWVKKNDIKRGDEMDVEEEGPSLIVRKENEKGARGVKQVVLDMGNMNRTLLDRYFAEFYVSGVEEIVVQLKSNILSDYKHDCNIEVNKYIKKLIDRFIGMEIISKTKERIIIQSLIPYEKFEKDKVVQNRVYFLIKEFLEEFVSALDGNFAGFHSRAYDYHDNIVKFIYYCLRLLNFSDILEEKKNRLFGLFMVIDKIIDKIRHTSERVFEMKKITPKIKRYLKEIFAVFTDQFDMVLKENYDVIGIDSWIKRRYDLVKKINSEKFSEEELRVISECKLMTDTSNDFIETFIALNMDRYVEKAA